MIVFSHMFHYCSLPRTIEQDAESLWYWQGYRCCIGYNILFITSNLLLENHEETPTDKQEMDLEESTPTEGSASSDEVVDEASKEGEEEKDICIYSAEAVL